MRGAGKWGGAETCGTAWLYAGREKWYTLGIKQLTIGLLLAAALCVALTGCGKSERAPEQNEIDLAEGATAI